MVMITPYFSTNINAENILSENKDKVKLLGYKMKLHGLKAVVSFISQASLVRCLLSLENVCIS